MNVSLTDGLANFGKSKVAAGRYSSSSEVVREALRLVEKVERQEAEKLQFLRNAWQEGIDSGDAGELDFGELKKEARATCRLESVSEWVSFATGAAPAKGPGRYLDSHRAPKFPAADQVYDHHRREVQLVLDHPEFGPGHREPSEGAVAPHRTVACAFPAGGRRSAVLRCSNTVEIR
jgi:antitoxin ParD1/3/4